LINDEIVQRLAKSPPFRVSISVYGANPTTYEKVTGHPEAYERVKANIKKLTDAGIRVQLKTTVIQYNCGEYEELAKLARTTGHQMGIVNYITPRRDGTGTDPLANRLEPRELLDYEQNAVRIATLLDANILGNTDIIDNDIMSDIPFEDETTLFKSSDTAFPCSAGRCGFWMAWDGHMYPCGLLSDIRADAVKLGFGQAWDEIREKCREVPSCTECTSCTYKSLCFSCPSRLKLETGFYDRPAPYLCSYAKERARLVEH
jgi:radical SAM protein with 4Fe4S-binding SPASM domain